ncbi:cell surface protein [Vagococcus penaei]|uniref:Cell surface protein n=1 Tax=Vagococcus penaei TaxID=633807 RepID=A0A1Q2D566_9ENTE|nr:cell surface protein [Vagococcus penaei]RST97644.1 cell surface protein [Vagococcus penaei]
MKKYTIFISSMALASSLLVVSTTQAADYTSQGSITFEEDSSITNPVDPLDPDKPVTPIDPVNPDGPKPGTPGPLSIDYASSFQFGTQKITTVDKDYYAHLQSYTKQGESDAKTGPNYIQITDKRGTQEGWLLSVKQEAQFSTSDKEELEGAQLSFNHASAISSVDAKYAPTVNNGATEKVLVPNQSMPLLTAEEGKGMGTWVYRLGDETTANQGVKLSIPGKSIKLAKKYETTLTWTLANTPENS